jgi:C1A family cysteine protease
MLKNLFLLLLCFNFLVAYTPLEEIEEDIIDALDGESLLWAEEAMTKVVKRPILSTKDADLMFYNSNLIQFDDVGNDKMVDLRPHDQGIRNQENRGWCTSFATIAGMENLLAQGGVFWNLSEKDLWDKYRAYDLYKSAEAALRNYTKLEKFVPYYGWKKKGHSNSPRARITKKTNLKFVSQIFDNLDAKRPILAAVDVTNYWGNPNKGIIPLSGKINGAHAVTIVGYRLGKVNFFVFKNSWGKGWGDGGYGYLPIDYCNNNFRCYFISIQSVTHIQ